MRARYWQGYEGFHANKEFGDEIIAYITDPKRVSWLCSLPTMEANEYWEGWESATRDYYAGYTVDRDTNIRLSY